MSKHAPSPVFDYYIRKADQHWEMFSLASADRDWPDAERHAKKAKYYESLAKECR